MSIKGRPLKWMQDALARGDLATAWSEASEVPRVELADALDFVILLAAADHRHFDRAVTRWIARLETERTSSAEDRAIALVALRALRQGRRDLRDLCERLDVGPVAGLAPQPERRPVTRAATGRGATAPRRDR
jgi:hypothetical protein